MEEPLITISANDEPRYEYNRNYHTVTFRQCLRLTGGKEESQRKLFILMASYWIFASFFISIQFFLYKKSVYCESIEKGNILCCHEGDNLCIKQICLKYEHDIISHILPERTLSYNFELFCDHDTFRFILKILPETLSFIGFILYGAIADVKGRKTAINISWRMFTLGVVTYAITEATYFKLLGYIIASIHCLPSLVLQFVLFFEQNIEKSRNRSCLLLLACLFVGPLVLSLSSAILSKFDNRILLLIICALPSLILSVLVNRLNESAVFSYPYDKLAAFNILNNIARENGREPIFIDLSRSYWHKYSNLKPESILSLFATRSVNMKLILGFLFMFANYFNMKMAQISLDTYTTAYNRSILISIPTALADITLCVFLVRFQHRTCKSIFMAIIWLLGILLLCHYINLCWEVMRVLVVTHSMIIRYLSELCYGIMIIWSIETFPTINRTTCTTFVFCGTAVGCTLAYALRNYIEVLFCISIVNTLLMMFFEKYLNLHKYGIMIDTFERQYYDENDKFYKF